jgi:ferredoxin--NADP+ reductase
MKEASMNEAQQVQENALSPGSDKFYSARITERYDISDELWVIRVDPGGDFRYDPGQYATLGVATPEKHFERAYSIVSAPHEKLLEFFVELVPHGDVTPRLYQDRVGDEFTLRNVAKGRFTLDTNSSRTNHLLVATVTGVAPFVSFARFLQQQWHAGKFKGEHKLFLIDGASRSWELGYWKELARLAAEFSWFTYIPTVGRQILER